MHTNKMRLYITVDRGTRGFGLSLVNRGLDKYDLRDTGLFVARVVPQGQAQRFGVCEDDKIMMINGKSPRTVNDAVGIIQQAGRQIKLNVIREVAEGDITMDDEGDIPAMSSPDISASWMRDTLGQGSQPISRSGSPQSINGTFGKAPQRAQRTPSPSPPRINRGHGGNRLATDLLTRLPVCNGEGDQKPVLVEDTVRRILESSKFGNDLRSEVPKRDGGLFKETKKFTETFEHKTIERGGQGRGSTRSLHDLGLDNYPNPEFPEASHLTRKGEKLALQNLNNRLAGIIDRMRTLQNENHKLYHKVRTFEEYKQAEISNVKELYDKQSEELKKELEKMNKNYNQLKVGADGLRHENEDLQDKVKKKQTDFLNAVDRSNALEDELRNLGNKLSKTEDEHRRTQDQLREILPELENLRARLDEVKGALDKEQLKSADLENKCQQVEEGLQFKMSLLEKELTEIKNQNVLEINNIDKKLHEEYEDRLQKALQELRNIYENKMQQSRDDSEKRYEDRIQDLRAQLNKEREAGIVREKNESRTRIEALISKVSDLEGANLALNQKIVDMAQEMENQRSNHRLQIAAKDDEIKRLMDDLEAQMKEYQNLHEIKIALDMEIAVFRRLIESEEDRLNVDASRNYTGGVSHFYESKSYLQRKTTVNTQL